MIRALVAALLLCSSAWGGEELVKITVFTLADGTEVQALRFTSLESDGVTIYSITQLDGKKLKLTGAQVASRAEVPLRLKDLPEQARLEIKLAEEARAAAGKTDSGNVDPANRELITAKLRENEAVANMKRITAGVEAAQAEAEQGRSIVQDLDRQIAVVAAELDATPKEKEDARRHYAARQAGLKADRQSAKDNVARAEDKAAALRKGLGAAEKKVEAAKAETARLFALMGASARKDKDK